MTTKALLQGGPADLAGTTVPIVPPGQELKIPHRGGYEHYKMTTRHEDSGKEGRVTVYQWWERTEVAE